MSTFVLTPRRHVRPTHFYSTYKSSIANVSLSIVAFPHLADQGLQACGACAERG